MPVSVTIELVKWASEKIADVLGNRSVPSALGRNFAPFLYIPLTISNFCDETVPVFHCNSLRMRYFAHLDQQLFGLSRTHLSTWNIWHLLTSTMLETCVVRLWSMRAKFKL